jgi:hypothetical protein
MWFMSQAWWYIPVITALGRMRQEDPKLMQAWATEEVPDHLSYTGILSQKKKKKKKKTARQRWLTHLIPVTWEVESDSICVQGQPRQIVHETPFPQYPKQNGLEG